MDEKKVVVNRKFLLDLADGIYNRKTRRFLRLCDGTLQNGPDPTDESRPMHCGLGELYFAMTGHQPEDDGVDENGVINRAVELSSLKTAADQARIRATEAIQSLGLSDEAEEELISTLDNLSDEGLTHVETEFREILDGIPDTNDNCGSDGNSCSYDSFRSRSMRVATQLRKAAKILPA